MMFAPHLNTPPTISESQLVTASCATKFAGVAAEADVTTLSKVFKTCTLTKYWPS